MLAHLSGDPALTETFIADRDVHDETARRVFGEALPGAGEELRRKAKVINFSIVYGTSAFSLAKELRHDAPRRSGLHGPILRAAPKGAGISGRSRAPGRGEGYTETIFGRIRQMPELKDRNHTVQQAGRRMALNAPIQGSAADLIKKAMIDIRRELKACRLSAKIILQVHDELVFEVPVGEKQAVEELVKDKMENVHPMSVPLKVPSRLGRELGRREVEPADRMTLLPFGFLMPFALHPSRLLRSSRGSERVTRGHATISPARDPSLPAKRSNPRGSPRRFAPRDARFGSHTALFMTPVLARQKEEELRRRASREG